MAGDRGGSTCGVRVISPRSNRIVAAIADSPPIEHTRRTAGIDVLSRYEPAPSIILAQRSGRRLLRIANGSHEFAGDFCGVRSRSHPGLGQETTHAVLLLFWVSHVFLIYTPSSIFASLAQLHRLEQRRSVLLLDSLYHNPPAGLSCSLVTYQASMQPGIQPKMVRQMLIPEVGATPTLEHYC